MNLRGKTVAIIGDSHMEALGPRLRQLLSAQGAHVIFVEARRGWSTRRFAAAGITIPRADLTIVELGGNDRSEDASSYRRVVNRLLATIPPGGRVIWLGPGIATNPTVQHDETAALQRRTVPRPGVVWWDSRQMTDAGTLRADGAHFTAAGYDQWSQRIASKLKGSIVPLFLMAGAGLLIAGIFARTVTFR